MEVPRTESHAYKNAKAGTVFQSRNLFSLVSGHQRIPLKPTLVLRRADARQIRLTGPLLQNRDHEESMSMRSSWKELSSSDKGALLVMDNATTCLTL